jgi:hypothetical protein
VERPKHLGKGGTHQPQTLRSAQGDTSFTGLGTLSGNQLDWPNLTEIETVLSREIGEQTNGFRQLSTILGIDPAPPPGARLRSHPLLLGRCAVAESPVAAGESP